ncbi:kinesin-like protein Klp61F [Drosophila eugracilis]|uniref:kinesin-like protein Klp61F n=1 Tax=Drosophila eugracilis TaxID=29029 RepID=UPI0007E87FE3|nr:kinesin-like protein Klp61F [Drosophila eugracilis]XP_017063534.1 kinesin-like protein Klp61F [Drosophila eugracilis]
MDISAGNTSRQPQKKSNQNIQVYVRVRPLNSRERCIRSAEVVDVVPPREIVTRHTLDSKLTKKFTFDRSFGPESKQCDVYSVVVSPLIEEVLNGYNCTVFAYGQTGTGKTHTMVGNETAELKSSWEDDSDIGIIPRAVSHLFDELRLMEVEYTMRISYLELYNEELCDLLSTDDTTKIRIFDDSAKKGSVIIQGLEEIPVHGKDDVYKLLEKGKERRKTATTLMNAQSSRSHTVFSIVVHIRENGIEGEDMLKIGKLNLVDLAGSENVSKAGNEKGIRVRETVNINQSLLTLGRVITALVDRAPHVPYRESKLTRLLQESLGGRTKTSIIATISPGHKDIEETLSTLEYAHRAKNIQNKPEVNQKLTKKTVLKEYTEEIDKLKRDLMAARDKNGIYLAEETYGEITLKLDSQNRELNEKMLLLKALKDELQNKEKIFSEVSMSLVEKTQELKKTEENLMNTKGTLLLTKKVLTKTKRRYKEKKELVASHVKTEQVLTTQAQEILAAADLATDDTHQLHGTIERRRDVDDKIRRSCDQFKDRMQDNLEMIGGSLNLYLDQQTASKEHLSQEIANSNNVSQRLSTSVSKSIEMLKKICTQSLEDQVQVQNKFMAEILKISDQHSQKFVAQLMEQLQQRQLLMSTEIQSNLLEMEENNQRHKTMLDSMQEKFSKIIDSSSQSLETHVKQVHQQLEQLSGMSLPDAEELQQLQEELANERALAQQEESLLESMMMQMDQIKNLRAKNNVSMCTRLNKMEESRLTRNQRIDDTRTGIQEYQKLGFEASQAAQAELSSQMETGMLCLDQSVANCSMLKVHMTNLNQGDTKQTEGNVGSSRLHHQQVEFICLESKNQMEALQEKNNANLDQIVDERQQIITEDRQRFIGHSTVATDLVQVLTRQTTEHAALQRQQLQICEQELVRFQQTELKTYAPTGTTPSKRDFVYPRTLVATSPHQEIVRRYRQEQDWSDLDTTATIDECSEGENEDSLHSVQELSETETIMNSTPIDPVDGVNMKRGCGTTRNSNSNALKPPVASGGKRSSSLSRSLTPRKSSPRGSPAFDRHNKENVA